MAHRIRKTWEAGKGIFDGPVEVEEAYMGGVEKWKHADQKQHVGGGPGGKTPVVGARDRSTNRIDAKVVSYADKRSLHGFTLIGRAVHIVAAIALVGACATAPTEWDPEGPIWQNITDRYRHCMEEDGRHQQLTEEAWSEVIAIDPSIEGRLSHLKTEVFVMRGSGYRNIILTTGLSDPRGLVTLPFTSLGTISRNCRAELWQAVTSTVLETPEGWDP